MPPSITGVRRVGTASSSKGVVPKPPGMAPSSMRWNIGAATCSPSRLAR